MRPAGILSDYEHSNIWIYGDACAQTIFDSMALKDQNDKKMPAGMWIAGDAAYPLMRGLAPRLGDSYDSK